MAKKPEVLQKNNNNNETIIEFDKAGDANLRIIRTPIGFIYLE